MVRAGTTREATVRFTADTDHVGATTIVRLPKDASERLPSRGQVAVEGTVNGHAFRTVLEPDGRRGHWLRVTPALQRAAGLDAGGAADVEVTIAPEWPEPDVPPDLSAALTAAPAKVQDLWRAITPMARWEWVRWVGATANPGTRQRRVDVTISKMSSGKRRPCCFDLSACTDTAVARSGKLRIDP